MPLPRKLRPASTLQSAVDTPMPAVPQCASAFFLWRSKRIFRERVSTVYKRILSLPARAQAMRNNPCREDTPSFSISGTEHVRY